MRETTDGTDGRSTRRRFLAASAVAAAGGVAGCGGGNNNNNSTVNATSTGESPPWYGSGPGSFEQRAAPGGTSMGDMPDLGGTINVYSGRGEGLVGDLIAYLERRYPDLDVQMTYAPAADLAQRLVTEGGNTPADVFYSVNAGALGFIAEEGLTQSLREGTTSLVSSEFRAGDNAWTGTSGRARTVPYNTNALSESDVPDDIMQFPNLDQYAGEIGWAPTYSSFQAFITAMRILEGEGATRDWLQGMLDLNVQQYPDEFAVSQAVADGELSLGFANHYYIQRVLAGQPNASIGTAFTENDAGTVFNVAGAARINASDRADQADLFVRHLLSAEAQEYFAIRTFEYPLVDGVDPVGRLPPISELDVPDLDLSRLSDLGTTIDLMQDAGVLT